MVKITGRKKSKQKRSVSRARRPDGARGESREEGSGGGGGGRWCCPTFGAALSAGLVSGCYRFSARHNENLFQSQSNPLIYRGEKFDRGGTIAAPPPPSATSSYPKAAPLRTTPRSSAPARSLGGGSRVSRRTYAAGRGSGRG